MSNFEKYRDALLKLWPSGRAWNKENGSLFFETNEGLSVEFSRIEDRSNELLKNLDPRTTFELLSEWEKLLGLPDECLSLGGTIQERIDAVVYKLTHRGGPSLNKQFFIDLAATLGYVITIKEPGVNLFRCGVSRCGDPMYGALWKFWFQVFTDAFVQDVFRTGQNRTGDRLRTFQNTALECVIEKLKPAHTQVQFFYGS